MSVVFGFGIGTIMGMTVTGLAALFVSNLLRDSHYIPSPRVRMILSLSPTMAIISILIWGIFGIIAGVISEVLASIRPGPGLGSPNAIYTLGILVLAGSIALQINLITRMRHWAHTTIPIIIFIILFGWTLPWLVI